MASLIDNRIGWAMRERVREREKKPRKEKSETKKKKKKKRAEGHISIKILVWNSDSSLLDTFSDELGFVTDNVPIYI